MDGRQRVAWQVRRLRVAKGITLESLAADAGVAYSYLSGIERGSNSPTTDTLDKLSRALCVDVAEFLALPEPGALPPQPMRPGRRAK